MKNLSIIKKTVVIEKEFMGEIATYSFSKKITTITFFGIPVYKEEITLE